MTPVVYVSFTHSLIHAALRLRENAREYVASALLHASMAILSSAIDALEQETQIQTLGGTPESEDLLL